MKTLIVHAKDGTKQLVSNIIIYYNRKKRDTGVLITVRVGEKSIQTNNLKLNNISGTVSYDRNSQGNVKRYGIACPLVIPIQGGKEPYPDEDGDVDPEVLAKFADKATKERERYQEKQQGKFECQLCFDRCDSIIDHWMEDHEEKSVIELIEKKMWEVIR